MQSDWNVIGVSAYRTYLVPAEEELQTRVLELGAVEPQPLLKLLAGKSFVLGSPLTTERRRQRKQLTRLSKKIVVVLFLRTNFTYRAFALKARALLAAGAVHPQSVRFVKKSERTLQRTERVTRHQNTRLSFLTAKNTNKAVQPGRYALDLLYSLLDKYVEYIYV